MKPIAVLLAGGFLLGTGVSVPAQNKGKPQSPQQARQELDAAKDKLKDANQELNKAEKEADKAEAAHQAALAKIQKTRQAAATEHGKKLGLPIALAQHAAAQRAIEAAQTALVKELRAQAGYLTVAKEAEKASARLQALRDDTALPETQRQRLTTELSKTIRRPAELEREHIEADGDIQRLRLKAAEAGRQVAAIQAQVQQAAEEDRDVKAAQQAARDAADKVKTARGEVDQHRKEAAAAQKKANTEAQQLQKAKSQAKGKPGK